MSKTIPIWCATVVLALGAGLSAQSGTPKPQIPTGVPPSGHTVPQPPTAPPTVAAAAPTITATGCLERWRAEGAAAAPTGAEKGPSGVQYVLTHVQGEIQSTSAGETKTSMTSPHTRYLLLPDPRVNFAGLLNHQVRIAGTIAPQPSAGASAVDAIVDPATRETNLPSDAKSESYQDNLIEVTGLTMVSRPCAS